MRKWIPVEMYNSNSNNINRSANLKKLICNLTAHCKLPNWLMLNFARSSFALRIRFASLSSLFFFFAASSMHVLSFTIIDLHVSVWFFVYSFRTPFIVLCAWTFKIFPRIVFIYFLRSAISSSAKCVLTKYTYTHTHTHI